MNELFFYFYFHYDIVIYPIVNFIYLYKKKESSYFIVVICGENIKIIDLENNKNYNVGEIDEYIDIDFEYTYLFYFVSKINKR